jgi:hypothetical protein
MFLFIYPATLLPGLSFPDEYLRRNIQRHASKPAAIHTGILNYPLINLFAWFVTLTSF